MKNIILTGVDGSETSAKAAEVAALLATDLNCNLHILSASDSSQVPLPPLGRLTSEASAREEMTSLQKSIDAHARAAQEIAEKSAEDLRRKFPNLIITAKGVDKAPANAILEEAKRIEARFVVVGNKHVQGATRLLGSVAATVARHITTDLYIAYTR